MGWKDWDYWIKGLFIGIALYLIWVLHFIITSRFYHLLEIFQGLWIIIPFLIIGILIDLFSKTNLSYWLKGGFILMLTDLVLIILIFLTTKSSEALGWSILFTQIVSIPLLWIINGFGGRFYDLSIMHGFYNEIVSMIILGLIGWFIIGIIIGGFVGKIKSKR